MEDATEHKHTDSTAPWHALDGQVVLERLGSTEAGLESRMLLQVHDELLFEVVSGEREVLETLVRDKMGSAYPLDVPLEVSVGTGPTWDAAAH